MNKVSIIFLLLVGLLSAMEIYDMDAMHEHHGDKHHGEDEYPGEDDTCCEDGDCSACMGMGHSMNSNVGDSYWNKVAGKPFSQTGITRYYYIAAEEVEWDYVPQGYNVITGKPFTEEDELVTKTTQTHIGSKYIKCLYKEYTSSSFTTLKARTEQEQHLGFMGPTIRAEVGDIIKIEFYNKCKIPASIHPHGVFYYKDGEGALYNDGTNGQNKKDDGVPTGQKFTYVWKVPERAGPGTMDGSSVMWMYHSHHDESADFYAGLVGNMVIVGKGLMGKDGLPKDVDQEVFWMYSAFDENSSPYINDNIMKYTQGKDIALCNGDPTFKPSNFKYSINGYSWGNAPLLTMKKGSRVRWYIMSMGGVRDTHTPHWHGNVLMIAGMRMDVTGLAAAEMMVADMVPDDVGTWLHHCHIVDHFKEGMVTLYKVVE